MLVLGRRRGQKIMIGDDIVVQVMNYNEDDVRIGITAPRHVPVYREEIYLLRKEAQRATDEQTPGA